MALDLSGTHPKCQAATTPLTGNEALFLIQGGLWRTLSAQAVVEQLAPKPKQLAPLDVRGVTGTRYVFETPFKENPNVVPVPTWTANKQLVLASVVEVDTTGVTLSAMVSQSVLGLQLTPVFVAAPSGTNVQCLVLGHQ